MIRPGRYYLMTYGCQMNENDSEKIAGILENIGYDRVDAPEDADLILFNTCCVRENAEKRVYGRIGQLKRLKDLKPELVIGMCGCMVQQEAHVRRIEEQYPYVDLVFGTHNIHRIPELLAKVQAEQRRVIEVWNSEGEVVEGLPIHHKEGFQAWITVMYGCNNFCTYCIVPYVRGRERSRTPSDILDEVKSLVDKGYSEFTLLGQNVNSYGKDRQDGYDFADLLSDVSQVPGVVRLRFTTSHPRDMTTRIVDAIAENRTICEHIHLPLQAGSDKILKRMNRGYSSAYYFDLVDMIRDRIPGCALTTDLIVGFPGETEEDFEDTLNAVRRVRYDSAFTFAYSPRIGTPAAKMDDQVSEDDKMNRLYRLIEVQNAISKEKNTEFVGRVEELLIEGQSEKDPSRWQGRTRTNRIVSFPSRPGLRPGQLAFAKITSAKTWTLEGELTGQE